MIKINYEEKTSLLYTLIIMFLFMILNIVILENMIEKELLKNKFQLIKYSNEIEDSIFKKNQDFKKSVKYRFAFYDKEHNILFSTLDKEPEAYLFETYSKYPYMYYQKNLEKNKYNVAYIITAVKVNYSSLLLTGAFIFLFFLIFIYAVSKLLIRKTAISYKEIQKYMDDFFNDAMHELKTPLGVINANLELSKRVNEDSKYFKRIQAATKQMNMTYEDIEYYIKNKNIKYTKEEIDFSKYLKKRVAFFQDIAMPKNIEILLEIQESLSVFLNETELQRIIDNTLSNAIKYSHYKGKIEVSLKSKKDSTCIFKVKDYGIGIKDTKAVFERFKREDETQGGFGLGLNIVKSICNKNAILVNVESKENEGSLFSYEIELYKQKFLDKVEDENK